MASTRLSKIIKELNISLDRAIDFLTEKGHDVVRNPNTRIDDGQQQLLFDAFEADKSKKEASEQVSLAKKEEKEQMRADKEPAAPQNEAKAPAEEPAEAPKKAEEKPAEPAEQPAKKEEPKAAEKKEEPAKVEETKKEDGKLPGLKIQGKIDLDAHKKASQKRREDEAAKVKAEEETKKEAAETEKKAKAEKVAKAEKEKVESEKKSKEAAAEKPAAKASPEKEEAKEKKEAPKAPKTPEAKETKDTKETKAPKESKDEKKDEKPAEAPSPEKEGKTEVDDRIATKFIKLEGVRLTGQKIDLAQFDKKKKKVASSSEKPDDKGKRKRRRIRKDGPGGGGPQQGQGQGQRGAKGKDTRKPAAKKVVKAEPTEEEISKQIKETLEKLTGGGKKSRSSKHRRDRRIVRKEEEARAEMQSAEDAKIIKVTEFATVTEIANMMDVPVTKVIGSLMGIGVMVTMNQRLDAETLEMVAEEFGFRVEFTDQDIADSLDVTEDVEEDLIHRAPIVTVMGHVDHGKTSLLDHIRKANVIAGEAGGITQHIGAYSVSLEDGQKIAFLDTPGHEAFTAMRARGAQVTDVAIIVVAADDAVMPQTKEAIAHAQAAGVPIVFAINKIDKPGANTERIKEQLAGMNLLVEDWGGKIQSQEISAKNGININELLEKVLLEAELLDLKANPNRKAKGTVIEASLDKGRGYVTTMLVQTGTLKIGDYLLAGQYSGSVRAMFDERGNRIKEAGPSSPVSILGLDGAPQAGDTFMVMTDEREAKQIAVKRQQLAREQSVRSQKNLTLEEIGRRLAVGDFQELNIVLKGDVDGSVEALSDSLQKLSTDQIQVRIIHRAVGQISDSDVLLASASGAIVVGFQVRPSASARKLAEKEEVDIRLYSIIYDAINEIKVAMEGMLSPELKEEIVGTAEIRETFKISKVGTIAGCMVTDGSIVRNNRVRIIRDGVVIYTGELGSLKRFKDDVKEVNKGYECGLNINNFNDIKVGDIVESFKEVEVKKTL